MNWLSLSIMMTALVTALACVLPGVFMVLRGVSLMSDAISHAILLGIVVMFFCVHNLHSPWLIIGAAGSGLLTVILTEMLISTACLKKDAAIGIVFPLFFSIAVVLINVYARDIHLDMDMVLLGELAFVPFNRLIVWDVDCGPIALWVMSIIAFCNCLFTAFFYKELKIGIFDSVQAQLAGYAPISLYYGLMALVSVTAVGAFDVVGSIVVVALMITPAATAYMISYTLDRMIVNALIAGALSALGGYGMAWALDVSIAGSIAVMSGLLFAFVLVGAPQTGLFAQYARYTGLKRQRYLDICCVYIAGQDNVATDTQEGQITQIAANLGWKPVFVRQLLADAVRHGMLVYTDSCLIITNEGMNRVRRMKG